MIQHKKREREVIEGSRSPLAMECSKAMAMAG